MCSAYLLKMTIDHPPSELTPDQQRAARDERWSKVTSMHWRASAPRAGMQHPAGDDDRARGRKPTLIPSRAPADEAG